MRRVIAFPCDGETLVGSVDEAGGSTGVVIVSGGNEVRAGAHRGMAMLANDLAARGIPVFRFDRRGVGDSGGQNGGWQASEADLAAAVVAFRAAQPQVERVVGFGNCDGATALALFGMAAGIDAVVLGNPWIGDDSPLPPPAAVRAHYARRLTDPAAWRRLLGRGLWSGRLWRGLVRAASPAPAPPTLVSDVVAALASRDAAIVLARDDRTARLFSDHWRTAIVAGTAPHVPVTELAGGSHSFAGQQASLADIISTVAARGTPPRE